MVALVVLMDGICPEVFGLEDIRKKEARPVVQHKGTGNQIARPAAHVQLVANHFYIPHIMDIGIQINRPVAQGEEATGCVLHRVQISQPVVHEEETKEFNI